MTFINYASREINCKIVYYGPGLCGKTTNLQWIYDKTNPNAKGKLISLATETDRTLFFDFLPLELGTVRGFKTRFHLYTVPGQVFYDASRKLILKGVDGVIFVADSQDERMDANVESIDNLQINLKAQGYDLMAIPYVLQLNKRDLPNVAPRRRDGAAAAQEGRAHLRGRGLEGDRRLRDAQGRRQARPAGADEDRLRRSGDRHLERLRVPADRPGLLVAQVAQQRRGRRAQAEERVLDHRLAAAHRGEEVPEVVEAVVVAVRAR